MHDSHTAVTWAKARVLAATKISWRNQEHNEASLWVPGHALYHFDGAVKFCLSFILPGRPCSRVKGNPASVNTAQGSDVAHAPRGVPKDSRYREVRPVTIGADRAL
jgi:hypothetical protein